MDTLMLEAHHESPCGAIHRNGLSKSRVRLYEGFDDVIYRLAIRGDLLQRRPYGLILVMT